MFFSSSFNGIDSGTGHIARDCSQSPDDPCCYNCNKSGHIARNCPDQDRQRERKTITIKGLTSYKYRTKSMEFLRFAEVLEMKS